MSLSLTVSIIAVALTAAGAPLIHDAQLESVGMYTYWQAEVPLADGDAIDEAFLVDEALYVITEGGSFFAIQADVGLIRWADKLTERDYRIFRPTHLRYTDGTGPVVIPTTTQVFVYDRFSGDLLKRFAPDFPTGGPGVGVDDRLYLGGSDGRVYSLLLNCPTGRRPQRLWTVQADGPVTTGLTLYHGINLLFASQRGTIYSCRAVDKTINWASRVSGGIMAEPALDDSGAYIASTDRAVYKLDLDTGRRVWRFLTPKPLQTGPVVAAQTVFQACPDHGLYAIDSATGKEKWRIEAARSFASHAVTGDFLFTDDSRLLLVDHETGKIRSEVDTPGVIGTVVNTRNDAVYLLGRDGQLLCARLDRVPYLRRQRVLAARAQLNKPAGSRQNRALKNEDWAPGTDDPLADDPLRSRLDLKP